jgi:hypothetical protein
MGGREVLAEVPDLTVASGQVASATIDLRGRLHVFRIELVRPFPELALRGSVQYGSAGSSAEPEFLRFHFRKRSELVLVTSHARIDASVQVVGCRAEELTDLGARTRVELRAETDARQRAARRSR